MDYFGKLLGGAVGLLVGGPLGAVAGAALGHALDGDDKSKDNKNDDTAPYTYTVKYSDDEDDKNRSSSNISFINNDNALEKGVRFSEIKTKIAGVTFNNRQSIVKNLHTGEMLILKRESNNQYDNNAISIFNNQMQQLGFIQKELSASLSTEMDNGQRFEAEVLQVTGGGSYNYGVNILIKKSNNENHDEDKTVKIKENNLKLGSVIEKLNSLNIKQIYITSNKNEYINNNLDFILKVNIDRSCGSFNEYETVWTSGEKIILTVHIYAKFIKMDEYIINEWGDTERTIVYGSPKILSISGEKYLPKRTVLEQGGAFPCIEEYMHKLQYNVLYNSELITELKKYYEKIMTSINDKTIFYKVLEFNESNFKDEINYGNRVDDRERETEMWNREEMNEYYGYDREYDGDYD